MTKIEVSAAGSAGAAGATGPAGATGATGPAASGLYTVDLAAAYVDAFGAASVYDQEFNRTNNATTLPTGWVAQNGNSYTYKEQLGNGKVSIASGFNAVGVLSCIVQPVSAATAYTAVGHVTRLGPVLGASVSPGLVLTDGTSAYGIFWNTNPLILVGYWADFSAAITTTPGTATCDTVSAQGVNYWRIRKTDANTYNFDYSVDGVTWQVVQGPYDVGALFTPTHFGFLLRQGAGAQEFALDWFRVR